jgi:hypothetical protein
MSERERPFVKRSRKNSVRNRSDRPRVRIMSRGSDREENARSVEITIRPFAEREAPEVRELFIAVNRLLSPLDLREAFEAYIEQALAEEIDRIPATTPSAAGASGWGRAMIYEQRAHD